MNDSTTATNNTTRRDSASSSRVSDTHPDVDDDEAALIDSLFMPGGILNPDQEEDKEENHDTSRLPPMPTSLTESGAPGSGSAAASGPAAHTLVLMAFLVG